MALRAHQLFGIMLLSILPAQAPASSQAKDQPLADWQQNPLPILQGDWEFGDPDRGGPAKIRISDRRIVMVVALNEKGSGAYFYGIPAGATVMDIETWGPDSATGDHQVVIRGTCYDYARGSGRPSSCWHVLTKYSPQSRSRTGRPTAWGIAGFEKYREEQGQASASARTAASGGQKETRRDVRPELPAPNGAAPATSSASAEADSAERDRTEELNKRLSSQSDAQLTANVKARQQFADAQAAHQRQLQASEAERRAYERDLELKLAEAAAFMRGLEAYRQSLSEGHYKQAEAQANAQRAEVQLRVARAELTRLNELKAKVDERNAPIEFQEGVVLCDKADGAARSWRCQGPLQTSYGELGAPSGNVALGQACGSDGSIRDLGTAGAYRAFGCGFGIHPTGADHLGNADVPALLGIAVPGRAKFRCPKGQLSYCRNR